MWLSRVGPGNHVFPARARFALLHDSRQNHWVLDAETCGLREAKLPAPRAREIVTPIEVTNDGAILYQVRADASSDDRFGLLDLSSGHHIVSQLPRQEGKTSSVHFSFDGRFGAWMVEGSEQSRDTVHVAEVGRLDSPVFFAPAERLGVDQYRVIDVVEGGRALLLESWRGGYLLVDSSGALIRTLSLDNGARPFQDSVRFSERGDYLAWDGYRGSGRYVAHWRINGQPVRKELARHSAIASAAVSSDWKWIAVSSQANTRAGLGVESVTVWFHDGTTRYHKRLQPASRASVVFLGEDLFAYPEFDEQWQITTRVFKLTE